MRNLPSVLTAFVLAILFSTESAAQEKSGLEGEWKLVTLSDHELYLNFDTDSVWMADAEPGPKLKEVGQKVMEQVRPLFGDCVLRFEGNGAAFSCKTFEGFKTGYTWDPAAKTGSFTMGQKEGGKTDKYSLSLENGLLVLTPASAGSGAPKMVLRRR
ncbi:hypothetical protein [Flaviaesturariibacter amylovorans]|uniref:Lipocalin-like domain-containing protein n=1 Tax=Flaviaesturariibacter amylovorans TaxID=1084520 RepID=A0ABP8H1T9_9BACT